MLIRQPYGLGDLLYTRKIFHYYPEVEWHILPQYLSINDYIIKNKYLPLMAGQYSDQYPYTKESLTLTKDYIPLMGANLITKGKLMKSKYELVGIDDSDWQDYLDIKRKPDKESQLVSDLGIKGEYALVNPFFRPTNKKVTLPVVTKLPIVNMSILPSYTLFDWGKVIEEASEVWTMDTSLTLYMEILKTTDKLFMFTRHKTTDQTDYLFKKKWNIKCY